MIFIHNRDIGYTNLPDQELATEDCFVQYLTDNPSEIYHFEGTIIKLKEDAFKVTIDSWMDLKLVPISDDPTNTRTRGENPRSSFPCLES